MVRSLSECEVFQSKKDNEAVVKVSVDNLMLDNTPHINFWSYLLLNDLLLKEEDSENFIPKIKGLILQKSADESKNNKVTEMFEKFRHIFWISEINEK